MLAEAPEAPRLRRLDGSRSYSELGAYRSLCLPRTVLPMQVGHLVPLQFEAYCRVLPPIEVVHSDGHRERQRWADLLGKAGFSGDPGHLVRQFALTLPVLARRGLRASPLVGTLSADTMRILVSVLRRCTTDPSRCIHYFWSGRAMVNQSPGHHVYEGELGLAFPIMGTTTQWSGYESPTALWPPDRSWTFAMHTDSPSGYIGGSEQLVKSVLAEPGLEASDVAPSTRVDDWPDRSSWQVLDAL